MRIYIVVPCRDEQETLPSSAESLLGLLPRLGCEGRILFVDDGSRDSTWPIIVELASRHAEVAGLRLAHNVGHQRALWAGMEAVAEKADAVVTIDADLQDDIEVIPRMVSDLKQGADIVYGVRSSRRADSWWKRNTAQWFYRLMLAMGCPTVYNHADYRLLSRHALRALLRNRVRNIYQRGHEPPLGI